MILASACMFSATRTCLICSQDIPKNSLIAHIAEHLSYQRHKCSECSFKSVLMENMVDHQNNTNHRVQFDVKNWYLDRVCQLIYSDFEYAQKNGIDSIQKFGSVFGDKKRLSEMLKTCEVREDDDDDDIKVVNPTPSHSNTIPNLQSIKQSNNTFHSDNQQEIEIVHLNDTSTNIQPAPDSSNDYTKGQTEQVLIELHRQITKGVERKMCKICHQMVENDYKSQKEHVKDRHMIGIDEIKKEQKLRWKLEQCFKQEGHLLITNDLQCNICGQETKYKDTRYHHVSVLHTDYRWDCVFPSCDFVVRSKKHFNGHLNKWHNMNLNQLEGEAKDSYIMLNSDFEHKLTPLVRKCFPFDLTNPNSGDEEERKRANKSNATKSREDVLVDSVVSGFMPSVHHLTLNRSNSKNYRTKQNIEPKEKYESSTDSDYTDSEHKSKPAYTKNELKREKMDKLGPSLSSTSKQATNGSFDNVKTHPSTHRPAAYASRRSRTKERYYESPLKRLRNHEARKQKTEDNIVFFRR